METYQAWNRALATYFLKGAPRGSRIYLSVNDVALETVGQQHFETELLNGSWRKDLITAVRRQMLRGDRVADWKVSFEKWVESVLSIQKLFRQLSSFKRGWSLVQLKQIKKSGRYYVGKSEEMLRYRPLRNLRGKIQLILTSPPFPLNEKKSYGNMKGDDYLEWFADFAPKFSEMLTEDGSIVIEIGNGWEPKRPIQSLLPLKSLMSFVENSKADLRLIQQFVCYNPSRLPSPAQWVTVNRIRTVDSFTNVWWIAKSDFPKADNSKVLRPYSDSMLNLIKRGDFNAGKRPSGHNISESAFLKDCGGSIAHNFIELESMDTKRKVRLPDPFNAFSLSNSASTDFFTRTCRARGIKKVHPARMQMGLAAFFIQYLTDQGDWVLDPFAGSNTTGYAAARLGRKWIAIDAKEEYVEQSKIRFEDPELKV